MSSSHAKKHVETTVQSLCVLVVDDNQYMRKMIRNLLVNCGIKDICEAADGIAALSFIPLVHRGAVIGKFMLYSEVPRRLTLDELQLAGVIASQVAFAVVVEGGGYGARTSAPIAGNLLVKAITTGLLTTGDKAGPTAAAAKAQPPHK